MLQICAGMEAAAVSFPPPSAIVPPSPFPISDGPRTRPFMGWTEHQLCLQDCCWELKLKTKHAPEVGWQPVPAFGRAASEDVWSQREGQHLQRQWPNKACCPAAAKFLEEIKAQEALDWGGALIRNFHPSSAQPCH